MSAPTKVCEVRDGSYHSYELTPEQFGFERCRKEDLAGGSPQENAEITKAILNGEKGPKRDAVLINAGAALYLAGKADTMEAGIALAAEMIDSGRAKEQLALFVKYSNQ